MHCPHNYNRSPQLQSQPHTNQPGTRRQVEWPWSAANVPKHWNIQTGNWLRFYIYERDLAAGETSAIFAASPSTFSRCFNSDGEGVPSNHSPA